MIAIKKFFKPTLLFFFSVFLVLIYSNVNSYEVKIITTINNEIITNLDVENEYRYLLALNRNLENIEKQKILNLAKESIIKEKIKKIEILKYYELGKDSDKILISSFIKKIHLNLGLDDENEFKKYLQSRNLTLKEIYKKIEIEAIWNRLIYNKYKDQINIDKKLIKENILKREESQTIYNLSEIFFYTQTKIQLDKKYKELINHINTIGFEKTALLYSNSETKNKFGLLGWIEESQLSKIFYKTLKDTKKGEITKPMNVPEGAIILKINDIKREKKEINFEEEFNKRIRFEKEKQLNKFSLIYFAKVRNILLNE